MFIRVHQEVYRVLWKEQKGSWVIRFENPVRPQFLSEAQMEVCQRVPAPERYLQSVSPERKHSEAENRKTASLALLQAFFQQYSFCTASEVLGAARSGTPAFADQFVLEQEQLGSFWRSVLTELPSYHRGRALPDWLEQTLDGLIRIESCFFGQDAADVFASLQQIWNAHWSAQ